MLVAMATGTGKTFTLVNQVYRLMKSGVGRRILLVDRALAYAVRACFVEPARIEVRQDLRSFCQRFQREDFDS